MKKTVLCTGCGSCLQPCDHPECRDLGSCLHACPNGCLSMVGEEVTAAQLAGRLLKYAPILESMGGGITVSGGEPMLQPVFVCELARQLGGLHKAIQTSGYARLETYRQVVSCFDYVMQDIKLADPENHICYTGVSNERILQNIRWLQESGKEFVLRVPLIPQITDTEENLRGIAKIAGSSPVELLPYNPLAGAKYSAVGLEYTLPEGKNRREDYTKYFENAVMLR